MSVATILNNQANAMTLGTTWGVGKPRSASEVLAFRKGLRAAGVDSRDECAIAGWLGGAAPDAELSWWENDRTSLESQCAREGFASVDLAGAMGRLYQASPMLANLIYVKATAKAEAEHASAKANAKQSWNKSTDELVQLLDSAGAAVALAATDPEAFLEKAAQIGGEAAGAFFKAIPGGKWTVGAIAIVVVLGAGGYFMRTFK